jgi:hypothetical protein
MKWTISAPACLAFWGVNQKLSQTIYGDLSISTGASPHECTDHKS